MKRYVPKNWGVYIAIWIIFGPVLLIWTVEPDWVARVIGMCFFYFIPPIICVWALSVKENKIVNKGAWLYQKFDKEKVDIVSKIIIAFAGILILTAWPPFFQDLIFLYQNKSPLERTAYVAHTRSLLANISEEVILDTYPKTKEEDHLTARYFSPRHIMTGNTYTFLILPHSRIIVEAIPVEIINR